MNRYTQPIVVNPDSVSHWSCIENKYGLSHHIAGIRCKYCHKTTRELQDEQQQVIEAYQDYLRKRPDPPLSLRQWREKKNSPGRHVSTD